MSKIDRFKGPYNFLSNFWMCEIDYEGLLYPNTEAAYQAAKTLDPELRKKIRDAASPGLAKHYGRLLQCRDDWENIKYQVMLDLVRQKFTKHEDLKQKLLATGEAYLEEGNRHGDQIWGTVNGQGLNWLGKILMQVRQEIGGHGPPELPPPLLEEPQQPTLF